MSIRFLRCAERRCTRSRRVSLCTRARVCVPFQRITRDMLYRDGHPGSALLLDRQALHCTELTFRNPVSLADVAVSSTLPADLNALRAALKDAAYRDGHGPAD